MAGFGKEPRAASKDRVFTGSARQLRELSRQLRDLFPVQVREVALFLTAVKAELVKVKSENSSLKKARAVPHWIPLLCDGF